MSIAQNVMEILAGIIHETWYLFEEAAPYLFLGFGIAGLLELVVSNDKIIGHLGRGAGKFSSVLKASIAGIPLPLCSCGVIPAAMSLKKRGANNGATLSFLISTPQTGADSIAITYALLDPVMTVFRPVATFITALGAGITSNIMEKDVTNTLSNPTMLSKKEEATNPGCDCGGDDCGQAGLKERAIDAIKYAYVELLGDIAKWLVVGLLIAGVISYIVPAEIVGGYLGGGIGSMILMLFVGIPLYICATASTPLAAALIAKGMSPGTAFVFLLAGPATNAATITMVTKFMGKKAVTIYLAMIALFALVFGMLLDLIYIRMGIEATTIAGSASDLLPAEVKTFFALLLAIMITYSLIQRRETDECQDCS
ncbi:SO_0444 family Cu/Zn efflux transporter [Methanohalophilus sp. WG1-DM]|uniref:SO_0444 family Cu/Zn efflux transporter n=1 Tax=Methanohalophilus sp. WG1-DM TaxID=2491675 RepID=UPI000FFEA351|nr:SO_0444 family Cu/Zn efflux transporter [Methanohalophilus sp. WG1-DM]RXG34807.1 permease [Methanohalophilus sp. WG1-DM]